jgi:hypothetical protein
MSRVDLRGQPRLVAVFSRAIDDPTPAVQALVKRPELRVMHAGSTYAVVSFSAALDVPDLAVDLFFMSGIVVLEFEPLSRRDLGELQPFVQPIAEEFVRYAAEKAAVEVPTDWPGFVRFVKTPPRRKHADEEGEAPL